MEIIRKQKYQVNQIIKIKYETLEEKLKIILFLVGKSFLEYDIKDRIIDAKKGYLYITCENDIKFTKNQIEKWYTEIIGGENNMHETID